MIVLSGAALVLPDRVLSPGTLVIDNGRIAEIRTDAPSAHADSPFAFRGHYIVPGFIDVHVHGVEGIDALDVRGVRYPGIIRSITTEQILETTRRYAQAEHYALSVAGPLEK